MDMLLRDRSMRKVLCTSAIMLLFGVGCRSGSNPTTEEDFHTSGSREADQRAEQRVSKEQQLRGEGEGGSKEKDARPTLYERLGAEAGVQRIVDVFVDRALADPRVNWERKGDKQGRV